MFILIKYMLGIVYLSISLLYLKESYTSDFKQLGRKDLSMEQLLIDSYMLLCKQKNSISINQQVFNLIAIQTKKY